MFLPIKSAITWGPSPIFRRTQRSNYVCVHHSRHVYLYMYICICAYVYVYMYRHMYVYVYMYMFIYIYTYNMSYVWMHISVNYHM